MQKWKLLMVIMKNTDTVDQYTAIITAVGEYLLESNNGKPNVSGSFPHIIYVKQGDSMHGKDLEGKEYYIKHVSGNDH